LLLMLMFCKKVSESIGLIFKLLPNLASLTKVVQPLFLKFPHQRSPAQGSHKLKNLGVAKSVRSPSEFLLLSTLWAHSWRSQRE